MQNKQLLVPMAVLGLCFLTACGNSNTNSLQIQPPATILPQPTDTLPIPTADLRCGDEPLAPAQPLFGQVSERDYTLWNDDVLTWGRTCHDTLATVRGMHPLVGVAKQ